MFKLVPLTSEKTEYGMNLNDHVIMTASIVTPTTNWNVLVFDFS